MKLKTHHILALIGATLVAVIALPAAVIHALTGQNPAFLESQQPGWLLATGLSHGVAYLAMVNVLVRERQRFATANRLARITRYAMMVSLALLAVGPVVLTPIFLIAGIPMDSPVGKFWEPVGNASFIGTFLSGLLLGLAVLRTNPLGIGGRVLEAMLPVVAIIVLLAVVGSRWGHIAYLEMTLNYGVALIGVGVAMRGRRAQQTVHESSLAALPPH